MYVCNCNLRNIQRTVLKMYKDGLLMLWLASVYYNYLFYFMVFNWLMQISCPIFLKLDSLPILRESYLKLSKLILNRPLNGFFFQLLTWTGRGKIRQHHWKERLKICKTVHHILPLELICSPLLLAYLLTGGLLCLKHKSYSVFLFGSPSLSPELNNDVFFNVQFFYI